MAPPATTPGARDALEELTQELRRFAQERDWRQFHSPKNLACALSVEAAELLEHFQWLTEAQSDDLSGDKRAAVGSEMADVLLYLLQLADRLQIDLAAAAREKLALNERRYPVERSRGSSRKYDEPPQDR
jgi:NTP pyrophosphatase (non-canonical NTP hydrolase)